MDRRREKQLLAHPGLHTHPDSSVSIWRGVANGGSGLVMWADLSDDDKRRRLDQFEAWLQRCEGT